MTPDTTIATLCAMLGIAPTAYAMGVSRRTIERWRNGSVPIPPTAQRLAAVLVRVPELAQRPLRDTTPCRIVAVPTPADECDGHPTYI